MVLKWILQQFVHLLSVNKAQTVWAVLFSLRFNNASVSSNIIFDYCSFLLKQLHNEWIIVRWPACFSMCQNSHSQGVRSLYNLHMCLCFVYILLCHPPSTEPLYSYQNIRVLCDFYLSLHLEWECRMFLLREQHWMVFIYKVFIQPWPGNLCSLLKFEYSA